MFQGRKIYIVSKHQKERLIAPIISSAIDVTCIAADTIDTDLLGTFSGEINRDLTPIDAARKKCEMAFEHYNCDLAIASEGSFGPHPSFPFLSCNEELVLLVDKKNNLEIIGQSLSTNTNLNGEIIKSEAEAMAFAQAIGFPEHGIILKDNENNFTWVKKDLKSLTSLKETVVSFLQKNGLLWMETDMRAMNNPTRQTVIAAATMDLANNAKRTCPKCKTPGFRISNYHAGLPCNACGLPTSLTLYATLCCQKCHYTEKKMFPKGHQTADPGSCNFCNP
ncbi:MAG: hypothetical protein JJT77_07710 [Crocinitomicaceae bacterium]|nr:hypothetical protein [Crocinitomicaceae bacterium]